jgi:phosphatidylglycerophosphatase A
MRTADNIFKFLSTACGLGLIPRMGPIPLMPGTWGALLGVLIHMGIYFTQFPDRFQHIMLLALGLVCLVSIPLGYWAERSFMSKDPKPFVLDEVAGYLFTATFFTTGNLITTIFWAFIVSRIFDIIKPWPVNLVEKLPAGWGILIDDLVASLYAIGSLILVNYLFPGLLAFTWLPLPLWLQPVQ